MSEWLTAEDFDTFGLVASGQLRDGDRTESVARLAEWGYVVLDTEHGNRPVALDPEKVTRRQLDALVRENTDRLARMSVLPSMADALGEQFARAQWRAGAGSEYLDDASVVNARLDHVVGSAEREILVAQPGGPRTAAQLNRSLTRDTAALDRGVVKRTLYRATVRDNRVTCEYARTMAGHGAEHRTLVGPFQKVIVVDRTVAFIANHLVEGSPEHSAWQVSDRAFIAYIVAEFEDKWRRAHVWHGEHGAAGDGHGSSTGVDTVSAAGAGVRTTRRQREILREVAAGRSQLAAAGRLGISQRTVSTEVEELKALFQAGSLPELTYRWALSPDRLVDDTDHAQDAGPAAAVA